MPKFLALLLELALLLLDFLFLSLLLPTLLTEELEDGEEAIEDPPVEADAAAAAAATAAISLEDSATAAPCFSLFISKAACIAEKLCESRRLSKAAANCCWRICSARK